MSFAELMELVRAWKDDNAEYMIGTKRKVRAVQSEYFIVNYPARNKSRRIIWLQDFVEKIASVTIRRCKDCGGFFDEDKIYGDLCETCEQEYSMCEACDERVPNDDIHCTDSGHSYCESCYSDRYGHCSGCGCEFRQEHLDDDNHCSDCRQDDEEEDEPNSGDGWKIYDSEENAPARCNRPNFSQWLHLPHEKASEQTLWLGFELEALARDGDKKHSAETCVRALAGRGILKADGSISGTGFELVTLPATLGYHQNSWGDAFWHAIRHTLEGGDVSCGFHVHVNRLALTALQIARLQVFLNDPKNYAFVSQVAGRSLRDHSYAAIGDKSLTTGFTNPMRQQVLRAKAGCDCDACKIIRARNVKVTTVSGKSGHAMKSEDKYQALNLMNDNTIEFRLFASNVAKVGVLKNLEFVHASLAWAGMCSNVNLTVQSFLAYCQGARGQYPNLTAWLAKYGHITEKHRRPEFKEMTA